MMTAAPFDFSAPAELYSGGSWTGRPSGITYRKFDTAAEAIQHVVENMAIASRRSCVMEVDEARFRHLEVRELYDSTDYPLPRKTGKDTDAA